MGRYLLGAAAGAILLFAGWLYVSHLQSENAHLKTVVSDLKVVIEVQERNNLALGAELAAAEERAAFYLSIKDDINASPSGIVPSDIRAALERLR